MNNILAKQLATDFCCTVEDVLDDAHHFHVFQSLPDRRRFFDEDEDVFLGIAVVNGKLLFKGREDILTLMREKYAPEAAAPCFFEPKTLREIDAMLLPFGYRIRTQHSFYIATQKTSVDTNGLAIQWYDHDAILGFKGDARFNDAYAYADFAPDMLGVAAMENGHILGMAGASQDSATCWQIGINVEKEARGRGIATMLVTLLKNAVLERGILPYYGMSNAHIASQLVALKAGFRPAWAELTTEKAYI